LPERDLRVTRIAWHTLPAWRHPQAGRVVLQLALRGTVARRRSGLRSFVS